MSPAGASAPVRRGLAGHAVAALEFAWLPLVLCAPLVLIVLLSSTGSDVLQRTVTTSLIKLIVVVGLYIFVGNSGVLSFGHMSFMAFGAYTSALLTIPIQQKGFLLPDLPHFLAAASVPTIPAALLGGAVATAFAFVVAMPLMRLTGIAAGIGTFAVLLIVYVVTSNWDSLTRGRQTMLGVPLDTTMEGTLVWACAGIVVAYLFQQSRTGMRLRGTREDEAAARSIGIGVFWERTAAFCLSAFWVGIAGALYAHLLGSFSPDAFYLDLTFITFVMLVVGGINSLSGAVIGSIVVSTVSEVLLRIERGTSVLSVHLKAPDGFQQIVLALVLLAILILRPRGLTGGREVPWPFGRPPRWARPAPPRALPEPEAAPAADVPEQAAVD